MAGWDRGLIVGCASRHPLFRQSQRCPKSRHCPLVCLSQTTLFACLQSLLDSSRLHISVLPEPTCEVWFKRTKSWLNLQLSCSVEEVLVFSVHPSPKWVFLWRRRSALGSACGPRVYAATEHTIPSVWQSLHSVITLWGGVLFFYLFGSQGPIDSDELHATSPWSSKYFSWQEDSIKILQVHARYGEIQLAFWWQLWKIKLT